MKRLASTAAIIAGALLLAGCTLTLPGVVIAPTLQASATAPAPEASATFAPVASATPTSPLPTATATITPQPVGPPLERLSAGREIVVRAIRMLDSAKGWAIGAPAGATDRILFTADGGTTWRDASPPEPQQPGTRMNAVAAFASDAKAWVAFALENPGQVPQTPIVWHTDDGGATWHASAPLDINPLMGIYQPSHLFFVDDDHGWLLVHAGAGMSHDYIAIYRTTDGGANWTEIVDPTVTYNVQSCYKTGLVFTSPLNGWMTGDCGGVAPGVLFFRTTDGGETWDVVRLPPPPATPDLFDSAAAACGSGSISFPDAQHGRMVVTCRMYSETPYREVHYLYSSDDGGRLWIPSNFPGEQSVFLTKDLVWAVGPVIQRSTDGGLTWKEMGKVSWQGQFSFVSDTLGWAVARSQDALAFVATTDGGKDWVIVKPKTGAP
jgi:photosystem II stability/assembly factor-like uncharacterized protein